ncbi:MAG: ABC transporter substrate-binding protein [Chloroflexota bacterium]
MALLSPSRVRHVLQLVSLPLIAVLVAACGGSAAPPSSAAASSSPAASTAASASPSTSSAAPTSSAAGGPSGTLTFSVPSFLVETFDPSITQSLISSPSLGAPIFQGLWAYMPPNGKIMPYLLDSATMAPDAMSWTLKLRKGITFSDGSPMTSADVKFSIDRYRSPQARTSNTQTLQHLIKDVTIVDPLTVKIDLNSPSVQFPGVMTFPGNSVLMLPKAYIDKVGWGTFATKPMGSGPYILASHTPGQSVTYTPSSHYWGGPTGKSHASFSTIKVLKVPDEQTRIAQLQSHSADIAEISATSVKQAQQANLHVLSFPDSIPYAIFFAGDYGNFPNSPLRNTDVRKALNLAIDRKALLNGLNAGQGEVANLFSKPDPSIGIPNVPPIPYDPAQAKQLLAKAGYPNGFTLKFWATDIVACSADYAKQMGESLASYWGKIGVKTDVVPIAYTLLRPKVFANPVAPDVAGTAYDWCAGGPTPAAEQMETLFYTKGPIHETNVADAAITKALDATSASTQVQLTSAAWMQLYNEYVDVPLYHGPYLFAADAKAANYPITPGLPDMLSWWATSLPFSS